MKNCLFEDESLDLLTFSFELMKHLFNAMVINTKISDICNWNTWTLLCCCLVKTAGVLNGDNREKHCQLMRGRSATGLCEVMERGSSVFCKLCVAMALTLNCYNRWVESQTTECVKVKPYMAFHVWVEVWQYPLKFCSLIILTHHLT
jgi:hypothetical protein